MSDSIKSLVFAVVLCLICSILLTTASSGLQRFQERNIIIDMRKNILKSVGLIAVDKSYTAENIDQLFTENIRPRWVDSNGRLIEESERGEQSLPVYIYSKNDKLEAYIIPINSRGLWGRILGYLALEKDGGTVAGFTVYRHSETPGLGGEIEKQWFQKNWIGKKITDQEGGFVSVSIAKGPAKDTIAKGQRENFVDGISGATLTGKYLSSGIKETLEHYEPVSIKFRQKRSKQPEDG